MAKVRDEKSERAAHPSVAGAFGVPFTQDSIAYGGMLDYDVTHPQQNNFNPGDQIVFDAATSIAMTSVEDSFISIHGHYNVAGAGANDEVPVGGAGTPADPFKWASGASYSQSPPFNRCGITAPPALAAAIFDDFVLEVNGTQVVPTLGRGQPYGMLSSIVKNRTAADKQAGRTTEGFILDGGSTYDIEEARLARFRRFVRSSAGVGGQSSFTLTYKLADAGFRTTHGSWLPPNVAIRLRMRRTPQNFMIMKGTGPMDGVTTTADFSFAIDSMKLLLARRQLDPLAKGALDMAWVERPIQVKFERVRVEQFNFNGTSNINIQNALSGPTPSAVYVWFINTDILNGANANESPFKLFSAGAWSNARISLGGGRTYPVQPLATFTSTRDWVPDKSQIYEMYRSTSVASNEPFLSSDDFESLAPLCFQIGSKTDAWDAADEVSVNFTGDLSVTPAVPYTILMVSFTDSLLQISYSGHAAITST